MSNDASETATDIAFIVDVAGLEHPNHSVKNERKEAEDEGKSGTNYTENHAEYQKYWTAILVKRFVTTVIFFFVVINAKVDAI